MSTLLLYFSIGFSFFTIVFCAYVFSMMSSFKREILDKEKEINKVRGQFKVIPPQDHNRKVMEDVRKEREENSLPHPVH